MDAKQPHKHIYSKHSVKHGTETLGECGSGHRWIVNSHPSRETRANSLRLSSIGALMTTRALMGLIAISVVKDLGLLNGKLYTMLIIMCLLTTAATGPFLKLWLPGE